MMRQLYTVAGVVLTPLIRGWLAKRARRGKENTARLGERFGYASLVRPAGTLVWLHAASVGEAQSVLTLVRALMAQQPDIHLLITTGTVTSAALIAQQSLARVIHQFVPVDTYPSVARFLQHWKPDVALWVESELWPQMVWQTHARGIPMLLVNARMSSHSFKGWQKWPRTIRSLLSCFATIYAGSEIDLQHFSALGAPDVRDVGNLKYDAGDLPTDHAILADLSAQTAERRVWVAASTHAGEELMVADAARHAAQQCAGLLCMLIPRHAVRGDGLAAELRAKGYRVAQRSKGERIAADTELYLADTMGELGSFYRLADIVFLGGSLVPVGGHNPLEPARLSAALMTGPYTHNFSVMMHHLENKNAICVVANKDALCETLVGLLRNDAERLAMAERALAIVSEAGGASDRIVQHVVQLLRGSA